jgi:hypothetical protein
MWVDFDAWGAFQKYTTCMKLRCRPDGANKPYLFTTSTKISFLRNFKAPEGLNFSSRKSSIHQAPEG